MAQPVSQQVHPSQHCQETDCSPVHTLNVDVAVICGGVKPSYNCALVCAIVRSRDHSLRWQEQHRQAHRVQHRQTRTVTHNLLCRCAANAEQPSRAPTGEDLARPCVAATSILLERKKPVIAHMQMHMQHTCVNTDGR